MFVNITGGSHVYVTPMSGPHIARSYNSNTYNQGDVRFDFENQRLQVFDGANWQSIYTSSTQIDLSQDAKSTLEWARLKRSEELELQILLEKHPHLKDAYNSLKDQQEKFELLVTLSKQY